MKTIQNFVAKSNDQSEKILLKILKMPRQNICTFFLKLGPLFYSP